MSPLNLVIVNDFGHVNGGAAQVAISSALHMAKKADFQVYYFCAVPPVDPRLIDHTSIRVICTHQPDILTHPVRTSAAIQGLWNSLSRKAMENLLSQLEPLSTLVHVHGWTKALSSSPIHVALKKGFPVLFTVHDYFLACPNGGFYNYKKNAICPLKALSIPCVLTDCDARNYGQKLWRVVRGFSQEKMAGIPSAIRDFIVPSALSAKIIEPYLPAAARMHFLPNPVDTNLDGRVEAEHHTKYVAVSRLSPEKGLDLFARAAEETGIEIQIIGDGPLRKQLEVINSQACISGWLPRDQVFTNLRQARALVFPSRCYETNGMVISEAASIGVPSIVSDITAGKELITENETGVLFQSDSLNDLMRKIRMLQDDTFVQRLSQNAYTRFWSNNLSDDQYSDELGRIYLNCLNNRTGIDTSMRAWQ